MAVDRAAQGGGLAAHIADLQRVVFLRDAGRVAEGNPYQGGGKYDTVGVGPGRAPWQCIGYDNGSTAEVMSLANEGSL